jgi:hypothetical protein
MLLKQRGIELGHVLLVGFELAAKKRVRHLGVRTDNLHFVLCWHEQKRNS